MNLKISATGLNLVLFDLDNDIDLLSKEFGSYAILNIALEKAIMTNKFVKDHKLKSFHSAVKSQSEFPHDLLTVILNLLKEKDVIFFGTYGLSYESVKDICLELYAKYINVQKTIFVCHPRKFKLGELEILNIHNISNIDKLILRLENS